MAWAIRLVLILMTVIYLHITCIPSGYISIFAKYPWKYASLSSQIIWFHCLNLEIGENSEWCRIDITCRIPLRFQFLRVPGMQDCAFRKTLNMSNNKYLSCLCCPDGIFIVSLCLLVVEVWCNIGCKHIFYFWTCQCVPVIIVACLPVEIYRYSWIIWKFCIRELQIVLRFM